MEITLTKKMVNSAISGSPWDLGNAVLYDLCKRNPKHTATPEILAKIWIIGRSYAAAIERRKSKDTLTNENFYIDNVALKMSSSEIDSWFDDIRKIQSITDESIPKILDVHSKLTNLFKEISELEKRSLASKYLHFHFPEIYFIYDTRAVKSISKLKKYTGESGKSKIATDKEYGRLFHKCLKLKRNIDKKYKISITPRQIDNILLSIT